MRFDPFTPHNFGRAIRQGIAALIAVVLFTTGAIAANEDADEWPSHRGNPQSTGIAQTELPENLEELWTFEVSGGSFESAAAIADGVVYLGDFNGTLHALDLNTGEKKWALQLGIGFSASPAVRDGRVYIGDLDGIFYCVGADGKKLWQYETAAEINSGANFYKDRVLFGSQDSNLYCLKAETGELIWQITTDDQIRCTPTVVENRAFVAGCDGFLHVIDLDEGKEAGAVDAGQTAATPAAWFERVYFGTQQGIFYAVTWRQPSVAWQFDAGAPIIGSAAIGTVASERHVAIFGDQSRRVIALDGNSGEMIWQFTARSNVDPSPVVVGDRVLVAANDGRLYQLRASDGTPLWERQFAGGFTASPAVAQQRIVIASRRGVVYCLGAR